MKNAKIIHHLVAIASLSLSACQAVNSSELSSTTAAELAIEAHVHESNNSDRVTIDGQIETAKSHIKVEFDQGEELYVAKGVSVDHLEWDDFSDSFSGDLFNGLDVEYVNKPEDGEEYYIKYRDSEGAETIISVDRGFVTELTSPQANTNLAESVELTWDVNDGEMNGRLYATVNYESDRISGYLSQLIDENDGSYTFDISNAEGSGTIALKHVTDYDNLEGFSSTDVDVSTSSTPIEVTFPAPDSNLNRSLFKSANIEETEENAHGIVQNKLESCLHECEEGETSIFIVVGEEYSCCKNVE